MRTNTKPPAERTHEGARASKITPIQALRRSVMSCFLWENGFYEDGTDIAQRISETAKKVSLDWLAGVAIEARTVGNLRHVPLLLLKIIVERGHVEHRPDVVKATIAAVIQRADELAEFVSIYWLDGKKPLSNAMKKGLAAAFLKFDAYHLGKYNR